MTLRLASTVRNIERIAVDGTRDGSGGSVIASSNNRQS